MQYTIMIQGKLGANLGACNNSNGAFVSSFYAAECSAELRLYDVLLKINGIYVKDMQYTTICEFLLSAERPCALLFERKYQNHLALKDLSWLLNINNRLVSEGDKGLLRQLVNIRAGAPDPFCHEEVLEKYISTNLMPLLSAYFHDNVNASIGDEEGVVVSFLPTMSQIFQDQTKLAALLAFAMQKKYACLPSSPTMTETDSSSISVMMARDLGASLLSRATGWLSRATNTTTSAMNAIATLSSSSTVESSESATPISFSPRSPDGLSKQSHISGLSVSKGRAKPGTASARSPLCTQDLFFHLPDFICDEFYFSGAVLTNCLQGVSIHRTPAAHSGTDKMPPAELLGVDAMSNDQLAIISELVTARSLAVLLTALLLERSVMLVYSSSGMTPAVDLLIQFLTSVISPLKWCHITDPSTSASMLDCPFPFITGVVRSNLSKNFLEEDARLHVLIFDLEYSSFRFPLPDIVQQNLHVMKMCVKECDVVLRPRFHGAAVTDEPNYARMRSVAAIVRSLIKNMLHGLWEATVDTRTFHVLLSNHEAPHKPRSQSTSLLSPSESQSEGIVVFHETMWLQTKPEPLRSFLEEFIRTQHLSNFLLSKV